jgi:hypothetical protein
VSDAVANSLALGYGFARNRNHITALLLLLISSLFLHAVLVYALWDGIPNSVDSHNRSMKTGALLARYPYYTVETPIESISGTPETGAPDP